MLACAVVGTVQSGAMGCWRAPRGASAHAVSAVSGQALFELYTLQVGWRVCVGGLGLEREEREKE